MIYLLESVKIPSGHSFEAYLEFLVNVIVLFGSDKSSSSSKSTDITSSKTTPLAWDFEGARMGFI